MTDTADATPETPTRLSPRDEARVRLALALDQLVDRVDEGIPVRPEAAPGDLLRHALNLQERVQRIVEDAVIAERERGTTWDQLGEAAGTTRQSAHERWHGTVRAWAANGRSFGNTRTAMEYAQAVDQYYARRHPAEPHAVTTGLDATRHPGSAAYEEAQRTRGQELHARRIELERDAERTQAEGGRLENPSDRTDWLRLAANRTAHADLMDALAQVHEELMAAEPALAEEHRVGAEEHRGYAQNARRYAELALERAGKL